MSFVNIFKISYYFDPVTPYEFPGFWVVVIVLAVLLVATIVWDRLLNRRQNVSGYVKELWRGGISLSYVLTIVGLIYLWLRYEQIMYFNWRLWPALLLLWVIGRGIYLIYMYKKVLPKKLSEKANRKMQSYYFRRRRR